MEVPPLRDVAVALQSYTLWHCMNVCTTPVAPGDVCALPAQPYRERLSLKADAAPVPEMLLDPVQLASRSQLANAQALLGAVMVPVQFFKFRQYLKHAGTTDVSELVTVTVTPTIR